MKNQESRIMNSAFMAVVCLMLTMLGITSCQDGDWDEPDTTAAEAFGNSALQETNVVTIAQLKTMYSALKQSRDTAYVDRDVQLKLRITGNDIGGNIYNYVAAQDENGDAILIYVYTGGLYSYLPVGQEILVDLKGLYVGANGTQPCISVPYMTSSGNVYPKNMSGWLWHQHFKLLGYDPTAANCQPKEYTATEFAAAMKNMDTLAGKLVTIKDVTLSAANGVKKWAPESDLASVNDFTVKRYIQGLNQNAYVNTSTSAKFASEVMPTGKINLTCIVVRYGNYAQLTLRTADDAK